MACKIERPDPQVLFNRYLQMFSSTVLGGAEVIPESNEWYATSINYAVAEEFYAITEQAWKERDPREACCENLIDMAERDGVYLRPPVYAQGYVRLTGTAGTELPAPLEFTIGGVSFVTASADTQPTAIGDSGSVVIRVRAFSPGAAGNISEENGTLVNQIAGVDRTVEVCGGTFCEGADAETCEQLRARYLRRLQYQPRATNAWILDKLLEWPCATRALQRGGSCCGSNQCPEAPAGCADTGCSNCGGQLGFYLMFDGSFDCGIAPTSVIQEAEEWLFGSPQGYGLGQVEVGICGRIVPVQGLRVDVYVDILACPSSTQITQIRNVIREFFTTVVPSMPLRISTINTMIANILGPDVSFEARFDLIDDAGAYGPGGNTGIAERDRTVYVGNCDLEPECDYMLCLRNVNITRADTTGEGCA